MSKTDTHGYSRHEDALHRILKFQTDAHEAGKLIELDAPHGVVILVRKGRVLVTTVDQSGHEIFCVLREAGAVIGLESLAGMVLPYYLYTVTGVELSIGSAADARVWLESNASPTQVLLRMTLEALRVSLIEQMSLEGSATRRLARLMLTAVDGDAERRAPAAMMLTLPKNVLARMLQMRAETFSRLLRKFEDAGAIALSPKLQVTSTKKLAALLDTHVND